MDGTVDSVHSPTWDGFHSVPDAVVFLQILQGDGLAHERQDRCPQGPEYVVCGVQESSTQLTQVKLLCQEDEVIHKGFNVLQGIARGWP